MSQTFATIIHLAPKLNIEEIMGVRKQLSGILGKEFELQADEDDKMINPVVAQNINFRKPHDGEVIYRLRQLAKDRNIDYQPSQDGMLALNQYCDFKGLSDPMDEGGSKNVQYNNIAYNPQPNVDAPPDNNNGMPPPYNGGLPPPGFNGGPGGNLPVQPQVYGEGQPPIGYQPLPPPVPQDGGIAHGIPVGPINPNIQPPPVYGGGADQKNNEDNVVNFGGQIHPNVLPPNDSGNLGIQPQGSAGAADVDDLEARIRALNNL